MATSAQPAGGTTPGYQTMLVILLGVNLGIVFLDRNAFSLLAPMIQPEFGLSNTQIGMITGVLAAGWALSSFGLNRLADVTGKSTVLLILATLLFAVASISSGLAVGFASLIAARALMGLAEGGIPPLSTHIVTCEVPPERRGLAIGMLSTIGINALPLLGPLVILGIGTVYGWREAFYVAGLPGLVMAALIWRFVRNPPRAPAVNVPKGVIRPLLETHNIRFTLVLGALAMTVFVGILGFLPLYLVNVHGLSSQMMGVIMTAIGGVAIVYGLIGPMLSDRIGRKPTIIGGFLFSMIGFTTIALSGGSFTMLLVGAMLSVAGNAGAGILIMVVIPGESAPSHLSATAMGFNSAVGELLGAGVMPVAIGITADQIGLETLPWFLATAALILCAVALGLRETAPRVVARAGAA